MEIITMYAIWDKKGERYDTPMFMPHDVFAKRAFYKLVADGQGQLEYFKEDFELQRILTFNVLTGEVKVDKKSLIDGLQIGKEIQKNEKRNEA